MPAITCIKPLMCKFDQVEEDKGHYDALYSVKCEGDLVELSEKAPEIKSSDMMFCVEGKKGVNHSV